MGFLCLIDSMNRDLEHLMKHPALDPHRDDGPLRTPAPPIVNECVREIKQGFGAISDTVYLHLTRRRKTFSRGVDPCRR